MFSLLKQKLQQRSGASFKLAVDMVIVNAQWHAHGYNTGNITSILTPAFETFFHT
jgi:hypothetical protein